MGFTSVQYNEVQQIKILKKVFMLYIEWKVLKSTIKLYIFWPIQRGGEGSSSNKLKHEKAGIQYIGGLGGSMS